MWLISRGVQDGEKGKRVGTRLLSRARTELESPMRILQVHSRYRESGGEDSVVDAERALLRNAGHTVELHSASNSDRPIEAAVQLLAAPWNPASAAGVKAAVDRFEPDIVHVHNTWFALSPSIVPAIATRNVPVVMTLHNYRMTCINANLLREGAPCELCVGGSPWQGVRFRCYRNSLPGSFVATLTNSVRRASGSWKQVTRFLALTAFARDIYSRAGLDPDRVSIKPNFVADPGPRPKPPSDSEVVVFVGRISEEKGADAICAAWDRARLSDLRLLMVGEGPMLEALRTRHPRVEFVGWQDRDQVRSRMLGARALVFPSRAYEGQSVVLLESLAAGLPVMASDALPIRETIRTLPGDWIRTPGDTASWAEGLRLLTDDSAVDGRGLASRHAYDESFTPLHGLRNLETIYRSVLAAEEDQSGSSIEKV
jgi:glycosyltransferase involved in cell wall biosynthesis